MNIEIAKSFQLANNYDGRDPVGMLMQEKFNGVRAHLMGDLVFSRNGNLFSNLPILLDANSPWLDVELYLGVGTLGKLSGLLHRKVATTDDWAGLRVIAFDVLRCGGTYAERLNHLGTFGFKRITIIQSIECLSREHMNMFYGEVLARGGEGIMLKDPMALYTPGYSSVMMKLKPGEGA